ncbi:MAG: hypothetical protein ACYTEQ_25115 [Planctomycetota bacterium]|jgi:hypothetical protein
MGNQLLMQRGGGYQAKVRGYNPLAYFPLDETAGAVVTEVINGWNGVYSGVDFTGTGPDGLPCPFWDGTNDYADLETAALTAAMDMQEGAYAAWFQVFNAGVWTDGAARYIYRVFRDAQNRGTFRKTTTNNEMEFWYEANNTSEFVTTVAAGGKTGWMFTAIDFSFTNDRLNYYMYENGIQIYNVTRNGLGAWVNPITQLVLGAASTAPAQVWHGWLAHSMFFGSEQGVAVWNDLAVV